MHRRFHRFPSTSSSPGDSHRGSEAHRPVFFLSFAPLRPGTLAVAAPPPCAAVSSARPVIARAAALEEFPVPRACSQCQPRSKSKSDGRFRPMPVMRRRPSLAAGAMRRRQRRRSAPTRLRPPDLNRTVQIRSDPSQLIRYRSTMVFLDLSPSVFPKLTRHPIHLKSIYKVAPVFMI